jgi:DNA polymerase-3 subunit epsilon
MLLTAIDLETTGLDPETLHVTEIAVFHFDTRRKRVVESGTTLVRLPAGAEYPAELQAMSNLDPELLHEHGNELRPALERVFGMMAVSQAAVAHNATHFERKVLEAQARRLGISFPLTPWIDTACDVKWRDGIAGKRLGHLAADHGFLNPFPHEAGPDVLTMLKILSQYDIEEVLRNATAPKVTVRAMVGYDDREKAKAAGFYFERESKRWLRTMRVDQLEAERFPFQVERLA